MNTTGFKTSEFVTALVPILLGVALVLIGALKGNQGLLETGMYLVIGGSVGYGGARGLAKLGAGIGGAQVPVAPASTPVAPPADDKGAASVVAGVK